MTGFWVRGPVRQSAGYRRFNSIFKLPYVGAFVPEFGGLVGCTRDLTKSPNELLLSCDGQNQQLDAAKPATTIESVEPTHKFAARRRAGIVGAIVRDPMRAKPSVR